MHQQYINGTWQPAHNGGVYAINNPATLAHIATIAYDTTDTDCRTAIDAAHTAFALWKNTNVYKRAAILQKAAELMRTKHADFAQITTAESGKPIAEATGEWLVAASFFDWYAEECKRTYGRVIPSTRPNKRMQVIYQPMGVVAAITAWNFPAYNPARCWAAALAAGCCIIAKPSEHTPLTAMYMAQCLHDAGLPAGVLNLINGDAQAIGNALLHDPRCKKISFTGSTRIGKILMQNSHHTTTKLALELGGNAPVIIFDDVNVSEIAQIAANAKNRNCGQVCVAPQRFIVHKGIYNEFCSEIAKNVAALRIGYGTDPTTQVSTLINQAQRTQVHKIVTDSIAQGAKLLCGGKIPDEFVKKGYFYTPTVLADVQPHHSIFVNEVFGPVISITPFDTLAQATKLANDTEYGLAAYIFTNNMRHATLCAEALEFGMVGINDFAPQATEAPFGGWKQSGIGHEGGSEGILEYMEKKLVAMVV
jgi:succinate-semialdehyde dehydrogenase